MYPVNKNSGVMLLGSEFQIPVFESLPADADCFKRNLVHLCRR